MALPTRAQLRELYFGESSYALRFQAMWIIFDLAVIAFFIAAPFVAHNAVFYAVDYLIAALLLADMVLRAWTYGDIKRWLKRPLFWADLAVLLSLILPFYGINLGFLRALRAYSLIQEAAFWRVIAGGRYRDTPVADTAKAAVNLLVFVFVMAGLVHSIFAARVAAIGSYIDSLYFTVTTLTTTGFGDIVLPGVAGRLISILIMIGGVSLFFRLIQLAMRPNKVRHPCPACGLVRHDYDAVHCKACGALICIIDEND
jgi:voltage-gated potassium channel